MSSVNNRTGVVTLTEADVSLGNADNTSDASKPVSTAQAATFFAAANHGDKVTPAEAVALANIDAVVEWSQTSRGGKQLDFLRIENDGPQCSSIYGLCE